MNSKIHIILKDKKVNKLWPKLFDEQWIEFINEVCLREKEKIQ